MINPDVVASAVILNCVSRSRLDTPFLNGLQILIHEI